MKFLVTGGAGLSAAPLFVCCSRIPARFTSIVNLDKLTYAGNLENLISISEDSALPVCARRHLRRQAGESPA